MSISTTMSNINRIQKDIASLQKQLSDEQRKEAQLSGKINQKNRVPTPSSFSTPYFSKFLYPFYYNIKFFKSKAQNVI